MKGSRITAIVLVIGAAVWIGSGVLGKDEPKPASERAAVAQQAAPLFQVAVFTAKVETHARTITLSGRTEADRKAAAIARAPGIINDLKVRRGSAVKAGDVLAVLSDEAREAQVTQARAKLEQRQAELSARIRLIEQGNLPAINRPQLEAELKSAEAALAQANVELQKGDVRAPISGIVNTVPVEQGQALQAGATVAEIVALDPMLAVVEIAETQLGGVKVGDKARVKLVTGQTAEGSVRFISRTASAQTRTYRVDIEIRNPDGSMPDGVTAEAILTLSPQKAARVPRSALTFAGDGRLGVRVVAESDKVAFVPVGIAEDGAQFLWLTGLSDGARVIVQGQDFVKEGQQVKPVPADIPLG